MGKGSGRRPSFVSDAEYSLRYDLAHGHITYEKFKEEMAKLKGKQK